MTDSFVDPRSDPLPPWTGASRPPASTVAEVKPLIDAISTGRLYAAEKWIAEGKPLQFVYPVDRRSSPTSPLQAAIWSAGHDTVLLLLCNGYRLDLERRSPLTVAFKAGRLDVVRLLLAWGADPHGVDVHEVVGCYDAALVEQFWRLGLDFAQWDALASALAYTTSNRPLYGFLKRHASEDPVLQSQLDLGLCKAVTRHRREDDDSFEKAVHLCVWAGADPWRCAQAPSEDDDDRRWFGLYCAAGLAVFHGEVDLVAALKLRPDAPHFQELYRYVRDSPTFDTLARIAPPQNLDSLAETYLSDLALTISCGNSPRTSLLRHVLDAGGRLQSVEDLTCRRLRDGLRKGGAYTAGELIRLLEPSDRVDRTVLLRIISSPKIIERHRDFHIRRGVLRELVEWADVPPPARAAAKRALRTARGPEPRWW